MIYPWFGFAQEFTAQWTGAPAAGPSLLYLSAGDDARDLTHASAPSLSAITPLAMPDHRFFVHVDRKDLSINTAHRFDHALEEIRVEEVQPAQFYMNHQLQAEGFVLLLEVGSGERRRRVGMARLSVENLKFARYAQESRWEFWQYWRPTTVVGVCDGCAGWGDNHRCENDISDYERFIPGMLHARYLITDHITGSSWYPGGRVPGDGDVIKPMSNVGTALRARQIGMLSESWGSSNYGGGTRLFELLPPVGPV